MKINVYVCEFGCHTVTRDKDKGVTPFIIKCRRKPSPERPIDPKYLGPDGECIGTATSSFYPNNIPSHYKPTHEWYTPSKDEQLGLDTETLEHVKRGGLLLRPIGEEESQ